MQGFPVAGASQRGKTLRPATLRHAETIYNCSSCKSRKRAKCITLTATDGREREEETLRPSTSLLSDAVHKRDFYAGGLMILIGLGIALKGTTYRLGTPMHMGPGFFPTALGVLLVLVGIAIAAPALALAPSSRSRRTLIWTRAGS